MFAILGLNLMKGKLNYCNFADNSINYNIYQYNSDAVFNHFNFINKKVFKNNILCSVKHIQEQFGNSVI